MISIVIVEDEVDILQMLELIVSSDKEFTCLATANNGLKAIEVVQKLQPNVVIMDIGLPDISGIECVKTLKPLCPNTEFLICTVHDEDENVFKAIQVGANSYMLKSTSPEMLLKAIKELHEGGSPMSSDIARKILNKFSVKREKKDNSNYGITKREEEVLQILSQGHTYQEVSDKLFISIKTLKKHIYNIYEKLQVDNKTEALNKFYGNVNTDNDV